MLHDTGEKTVKERLEELKMLGLSGSGSVDNKEGLLDPRTWPIFGGGKKGVKLSVLVDGERVVDVKQYIILYAWNEYFGSHTKEEQRECELRYYKSDEQVHYIEGGNDRWTKASQKEMLPQYWRAQNQFYATQNGAYEVIEQKVNFYPRTIEEVRRYKDGTENLWQLRGHNWSDITPT